MFSLLAIGRYLVERCVDVANLLLQQRFVVALLANGLAIALTVVSTTVLRIA